VTEQRAAEWLLEKSLINPPDITIDYILDKYRAIVDANVMDIVEYEDGQLHLLDKRYWPQKYLGNDSPIASIGAGQYGVAVKMLNKQSALKDLSYYMGILSDFNMALGTMRKYGINLVESEPGQWVVDKVPAPVQMDLFG
jgi:hypothetical protein